MDRSVRAGDNHTPNIAPPPRAAGNPHTHPATLCAPVDKYCLDQTRILDSLAVLPLSLAGCRKLVIFYGPSYLSRLWCIIELFVFLEMGKELSDIELRKLDTGQQV